MKDWPPPCFDCRFSQEDGGFAPKSVQTGKLEIAPMTKAQDNTDCEIRQRLKAEKEKLQQANQELEERIEKRTDQLRAMAARLITLEDEERQRLSEFLHDTLQQQLAVIKIRVQRLIPMGKRDKASERRISETVTLVDEAIAQTRQLSRELNPLNLRMHGLYKALQFLSQEMRDRYGLAIILDLDPEVEPHEESVASILFRAIREMLFNVVKHSGVATAIMRTFRDGEHTVMSVEDQGDGTDMTRLKQKWDSGECLGLLSIEEQICKLRGEMFLDTQPGRGFRISLMIPFQASGSIHNPLIQPKESTVRRVKYRPPGELVRRSGVTRVLLADDHEVMRESLAVVLMENNDFEIVGEAQTGREAIQLAEKLRPDVIIMDVEMPEMNGIAAVKIISRRMPQIKLIGLSMHDDEETCQRMQSAGAEVCLSKTTSIDQLCDVIRQCLAG